MSQFATVSRRTARQRQVPATHVWRVVVGFADRPISVTNPLVRVVHQDDLLRAKEVLHNQGFDARIVVFACRSNITARDWADSIFEKQDALAAGHSVQPLRMPAPKRRAPIDPLAIAGRVSPSDDPFGYFNGYYRDRIVREETVVDCPV